jgi:TolA-binding protein
MSLRHQAAILALLLTCAATAYPAVPSTCGAGDDYGKALCAYQHRHFAEAEAAFRSIVEKNVPEPQTLRAVYFLARTEMKTGRFDEASTLLIRIHDLDPAFYAAWNCDYLLGECRRATGKE